MRKPLSPRQQEVLDHIKQFIAEHGYSPTYKELAEPLGVNIGTIRQHCDMLVQKAWLSRRDGQNRTIRPID